MVAAAVGSKKAIVPPDALLTGEHDDPQQHAIRRAPFGYVSNSDQDTLREILEHTLQALIEAEAAGVVGAQPHERTESRVGHCNGHRPRTVDTRVGRLELGIPKLRQGSFLPSLLESRRQSSRSLRPAALLLLASTPGSRRTPEVGYRAPRWLARAGLAPAGRSALRLGTH